MRRPIIALVAAALPVLVIAPSAHAADATAPLFAYVKAADGSYGYDSTRPVSTYPSSGQQVQIPVEYTQQTRQLKSAWVATIGNLNFGKPTGVDDFKARYDTVLDEFESWNMNAMIFQVRPLLDAYYPSELNPWSEFLGGPQGTDPGYDPLEWMVDETHKRGMEYHAWLNPYRVTNTKMSAASIVTALGLSANEIRALSIPDYIAALNAAGILADDNYAVLHPTEVLSFEEKLFLNPGIPAVQESVAATVAEIVENYDVDAIHFDDYFYPYRITVAGQNVYFGAAGEDRATFQQYGLTAGYPDTAAGIQDWRRDNVTSLVTQVKASIDAHNDAAGTAVQFGVSPFGIWEHAANNPDGSHTPTGSSQTYSNTVFADTRGWVKSELIDYIAPQIYWAFDQAAAPYGELAQWWNDVADGTHVQVYVGHALYKHVSNGGFDPAWMNPEEVPNQLKFNQTLSNVRGSVLFSYNDIRPSDLPALPADQQPRHNAKNQAIELLKGETFAAPSIVPAKPWLSDGPVAAPLNVALDEATATLSWTNPDASGTRQFAVYAGTGTPEEIVATPGTLVDTVWAGGQASFSVPAPAANPLARAAALTWVVTALDNAAVESAPVAAALPEIPGGGTTTTTPGSTDPGAGAGTSAQTGGTTAYRASSLPTTGADATPLLTLAIALLGAGALLTAPLLSRRRENQAVAAGR